MASKKTATKIDIYSFAIIMWELFFELVPYSKSVKLTQLYPVSPEEDKMYSNISMFNIPSLVVKGLRPAIPFKTPDQIRDWISEYMPEEIYTPNIVPIVGKYFEIVKTNWDNNSTLRSSISTIRSQLEQLEILLDEK